MASIINASTSGAGGVITTADNSGILQLQTGGVTALTIDASQNVTGNISASSMTLLGTITPTAANSISLTGLTLTNYKQIQIVLKNIANGGTGGSSWASYVSGDNTQATGLWMNSSANNTTSAYGFIWIDLNAGALSSSYSSTTASAVSNRCSADTCNLTTSSTTIYLRNASTSTWTAQGTIYIYGVR